MALDVVEELGSLAEDLAGAFDLEGHEAAKVVVEGAVGDLLLGDAVGLEVLQGEVDAAFLPIAIDVLPEVGELEGGAGVVGETLALFVPVVEDVEEEAATWVGGVIAVVEEVIEGWVAGDFLVHAVGFDELEEGFAGDAEELDGLLEGDHDGVGGSFAGVATFEVFAPLVEEVEAVAVGFVAEVVDGAAVGVEVGDVLEEGFGEEEGADGEVFVVGPGELASVAKGLLEGPAAGVEGENGGHGLCSVEEAAQGGEGPVVAVEMVVNHEAGAHVEVLVGGFAGAWELFGSVADAVAGEAGAGEVGLVP